MVRTKNNTGQRARATTRLFQIASALQAKTKTCMSNARKCLFYLFPIQRMKHLSYPLLGSETACLCFTAEYKRFPLSLFQTNKRGGSIETLSDLNKMSTSSFVATS